MFIKIEAALTRVLNTQRLKNIKRKTRAFKRIEANVRAEALSQRTKASAYLLKVRDKLDCLFDSLKQ